MVKMVLNRRYRGRVDSCKYEYIFSTIYFKIERHQLKKIAAMIQTAFHPKKDLLGN
jgi:hypothetical protein